MRLSRGAGPTAISLTGARLVRLLPAPLLVTTAASVASWWPFWAGAFPVGLVNTLVPVSFVAIGMVLRQDPVHRPTGTLMLLAAPCYLVSWWWAWPPRLQVGPLPILSFVLGYFWFVCGGLALARYPDARLLHRSERIYFAGMAAWIGVFKIAIAMFSRPEWNRFPAQAWWPTVMPSHPLHDALRTTFSRGIAVIAVGLLVVLVRKLRRLGWHDRVDSLPVVLAACAVAVCGGAYFASLVFKLSVVVSDALRVAGGVAALVTPLAFLASVLQRALARSSVADLVLRLSQEPSVDGVQRAVRSALHDPELRVLFWMRDAAMYVNALGQPWDKATDGRWSVPVEGQDGHPLAMLLIDPTLRRHAHLVSAVVVAGGLALENGRLHADIAAQLREVRASRSRIVEGAIAERRRLERNLHDGAQQSLLAVTAALSEARLRAASDPDVTATIDRARVELKRAREELRDLARGIHPAVLSQSGLGPAIESVAERLRLAVSLVVPEQRLPPPVETTCYFVVAEALTNVARHADIRSATVDVAIFDGRVEVEIDDDGRGGADPAAGSGLAGLADRVRALGGELTVISRSGSGTRVKAYVPCG